MNIQVKPEHFAAMVLDPFGHFDSPMAVVAEPKLTKSEKLEVLRSMDQEARELEVAAEENMGGGETHPLAEVRKAIHHLAPELSDAPDAASGNTKHG